MGQTIPKVLKEWMDIEPTLQRTVTDRTRQGKESLRTFRMVRQTILDREGLCLIPGSGDQQLLTAKAAKASVMVQMIRKFYVLEERRHGIRARWTQGIGG
jgi:hypothetical protein